MNVVSCSSDTIEQHRYLHTCLVANRQLVLHGGWIDSSQERSVQGPRDKMLSRRTTSRRPSARPQHCSTVKAAIDSVMAAPTSKMSRRKKKTALNISSCFQKTKKKYK